MYMCIHICKYLLNYFDFCIFFLPPHLMSVSISTPTLIRPLEICIYVHCARIVLPHVMGRMQACENTSKYATNK